MTNSFHSKDPRAVFCSHLRSIGIKASPEGSGKLSSPTFGMSNSQWPIVVDESLICQIVIRENFIADMWESGSHCKRRSDYLVPDSRIRIKLPHLEFHTVRVRGLIFKKEIPVQWEALEPEGFDSFTLEVVRKLNQDETLMKALTGSYINVGFGLDHSSHCWVRTEYWEESHTFGGAVSQLENPVLNHTPSSLQWNCYQMIARHLLETPMPTVE